MRETKQVIVIRRDLGMRRGKEVAQGSHASSAWETQRRWPWLPWQFKWLTRAQRAWLNGAHAKVVCQVPDLPELMRVQALAQLHGLKCHVITDAGRTEFHGEPTVTALAIGPDWSEKIDPVTRHLALY